MPAEHGTVSRYTNGACRCRRCTEAQRVYYLAYRHTPAGRAAKQRADRAYRQKKKAAQ